MSNALHRNKLIHNDAFLYYPALKRLSHFVEINISKDISLAEAADIAHMERTYFSAYFHKKTGFKFHDWITRTRIEHAQELFRQSDSLITTVAFESGFNNLRTFQRAFKKHSGLTPSSFKKTLLPSYRNKKYSTSKQLSLFSQ